MRYVKPRGTLLALVFSLSLAAQEAPAPAADCTFNAMKLRSPRETYHELSLTTELVSPSRLTAQATGTARSSDAEFLRRVTLDLSGEIPDVETLKAFLADTDANKRDKAIDRLLNSPAFADRWTMWFGDHIQNVQFAQNTSIFPDGRDAYHRY